MKLKTKIIIFTLLISAAFTCIGCLEPISLDRYGYVMTLGVDVGNEKEYEIILELQRESSGESVEEEGGAIILSQQADNVQEAINELYQRLSYELNFSRTHLIVFSQAIARKGEIEKFFTISLDQLRIRQSAIVMITDCTVKEFIGGRNSNEEVNLTKVQENMLFDAKTVGQIMVTNLAMLFEACDSKRFDAALTYGYISGKINTDAEQKDNSSSGKNPVSDTDEALGGMKSYLKGVALFDGWRMVDTLSAHDTQFLNIASGMFENGSIKIDNDNYKNSSLQVQLGKYSIDVVSTEKPRFKIKILLNITIEYDSTDTLGKKWEQDGKFFVENYFVTELSRVFERCQKNNSDAIGLGKAVSRKFERIDEWEEFNWKEKYRDAEVEFEIEAVLIDYYTTITRQ